MLAESDRLREIAKYLINMAGEIDKLEKNMKDGGESINSKLDKLKNDYIIIQKKELFEFIASLENTQNGVVDKFLAFLENWKTSPPAKHPTGDGDDDGIKPPDKT